MDAAETRRRMEEGRLFTNVFVKYCSFYIFIIKNIANLKKCTIKQACRNGQTKVCLVIEVRKEEDQYGKPEDNSKKYDRVSFETGRDLM